MTYKNKKVYTATYVASKLNIPRSNIQQYIDKKFITPSIKRAKGKGTKNEFSIDDIYLILLFLDLHKIGLPQPDAAKLAREIMNEYEDVMNDGEWEWVIVHTDSKDEYITELVYGPRFQQYMDKTNLRFFSCINLFKIKIFIDSTF